MEIAEDKEKARFFEISFLNVLFCMLVIFVHATSKTISDVDKSSLQYLIILIPWRLSHFVVQGFIFLSGIKLFLNKSDNIDYEDFFIKRLVHIVLPYIAWVFVYYVYFCKNNYFPFKWLDFFRYVLIGDLVSHFYFVIIIIQFYLLTPFWLKLVKKSNSAVLIVLSLMLTVILGQSLPDIIKLFFYDFSFKHTGRIFTTYLVYWISGCYAGLYYEKFKEILYENRITISVAFFTVSFCNAALSYLDFSGKRSIHWLENVHIMYCICAILFFYMISLLFNPHNSSKQKILQKTKKNIVGMIKNIDKISYTIYLSHCLVIFIINDFLSKFQGIPIGISYLIRLCAVYIVTIGGLLFWNNIKKRCFHDFYFV